jgi:prevent-host-death family protein
LSPKGPKWGPGSGGGRRRGNIDQAGILYYIQYKEGTMIDLVQNIKPISYVKAHTTEVVKTVGETKSPIVITQNGEAKAVIIDIESYQKTLNAINLAKLLSFSEMDLRTGNTVTHEEAKRRFEKIIQN